MKLRLELPGWTRSFAGVTGLTTAALCAAVFLFTLATLPPRARRLSVAPEAGDALVVAGALHVHTRQSDGTGTIEDVAAAAARAGLRFVIVTNHGDGTRIDAPAYRSGVLCIDAVEVSTAAGHFIGIGTRPAPYPLGGEARDVVEDVTRLGGFGVAPHPDSPKPALRWRDWGVPIEALEWLNADSEWRASSWMRLGHALLEYPLRGPESIASLFSRPDETLARWDRLTQQRRVVALAGHDAHARIGFGRRSDPYEDGVSLHLPSYETMFRTFALRVEIGRPMTGRADLDAHLVRQALAAGHVYTAIDALAAPPRFDFSARSGALQAREGDRLALAGPVTLRARVNAPRATVVLIENGRAVAEAESAIEYRAEARDAVFRVEVRLPGAPGSPAVPWIVSNPIYVGDPPDRRTPLVRAGARDYVAVSGSTSEWASEHEERSAIAIRETTAASLTFDYRLADGPRRAQYVALVHRVAGLAGMDRLAFRARASRPMRLSVQLRAATADAPRWQRSVYVDPEPRDITVFLDDVRPIGPTPSWLPDLARIGSVLFVIDTTNAAPGTTGHVTLEDVSWGRAMGGK